MCFFACIVYLLELILSLYDETMLDFSFIPPRSITIQVNNFLYFHRQGRLLFRIYFIELIISRLHFIYVFDLALSEIIRKNRNASDLTIASTFLLAFTRSCVVANTIATYDFYLKLVFFLNMDERFLALNR